MRVGRGLLPPVLSACILAIVVGACTFTVGVSDLQNGSCSGGTKACRNQQNVMQCVGLDRPEFGCARAGCAPCDLPNATTRCDPANNCAVAVCSAGFAHCSANPADGCEANIGTDIRNCGQDPSSACGNNCDSVIMGKVRVTTSSCVNGVCQIGGCQPGYQDCDKQVGTGCECPSTGTCTPAGGCPLQNDAGNDSD
jgi:hypothetical protein